MEITIAYDGRPIGHITLNLPGDGLFEEERDELKDGKYTYKFWRPVTAIRAGDTYGNN